MGMSRLCGLGVHGLFCPLADCGALMVSCACLGDLMVDVGMVCEARKRRDITCIRGSIELG